MEMRRRLKERRNSEKSNPPRIPFSITSSLVLLLSLLFFRCSKVIFLDSSLDSSLSSHLMKYKCQSVGVWRHMNDLKRGEQKRIDTTGGKEKGSFGS